MKASIHTYQFSNGTYTVSKGLTTKFDWFVSVELSPINHGSYIEKRLIKLDRNIFLTLKCAKSVTEALLKKYNLL